jgi:hypothetical protein
VDLRALHGQVEAASKRLTTIPHMFVQCHREDVMHRGDVRFDIAAAAAYQVTSRCSVAVAQGVAADDDTAARHGLERR